MTPPLGQVLIELLGIGPLTIEDVSASFPGWPEGTERRMLEIRIKRRRDRERFVGHIELLGDAPTEEMGLHFEDVLKQAIQGFVARDLLDRERELTDPILQREPQPEETDDGHD